MTFNTGNNVPSTDPRDLYDNAENLDKLVNGVDPFYADRLGKLRQSWAGMENDFDTSQAGRENAFTLSQADKESRFQAFLVSSGYVGKGDYAAGVVLAERNEYVAVDAATTGTAAAFYRPGPSAALPLTLTGTWATDSANLVLLGDDVLRQELAASAGSEKVGYNAGALNAITRTLQSKARDIPSAFDFLSADERVDIQSGAKQHDHTTNFQKFLDAMRGFNDPEFRYGEVPGGDYNVTQLVLTDYENVVLDMKGARIYGIATDATDSIVKMINAINFKIQGSWVLNGLDKLNYDCGLWSTTGPGDGISVPVVGGSSLVQISGLKGYRLKEAVRLGAYNADVSIAETLIDGLMTRLCPMALRVAGSQTGAQVSNSILISDPGNFGAGIQEEVALKMEGGFCTVTGGKMLHLQSGYGALIRLSPCESANYGNQFPTATFDGVHVETAAFIAQIDNPRALPSPASGLASLAFSACQGYVGAIPSDQPLILVDTPDFNGKIKGRANNFYSHVVPRTAANIACTNSTAQFTTDFDSGSFGTGCKHSVAGVLNGGPALHSSGQVIYASNLAGQSIAAGATSALKWTEKATGGMKPRYNNFYDATTGEFTVPYFSTSLRIRGSATFTTAPSSNARLRITRNGIEVAYKFVLAASDTGVDISFDADEVQPGTKFKVELVNPGASAITFGSSGTDYLAISLATA